MEVAEWAALAAMTKEAVAEALEKTALAPTAQGISSVTVVVDWATAKEGHTQATGALLAAAAAVVAKAVVVAVGPATTGAEAE